MDLESLGQEQPIGILPLDVLKAPSRFLEGLMVPVDYSEGRCVVTYLARGRSSFV